MAQYLEKNVTITVKTYPLPSKKMIEASCTAGITDDGKWIRLFPLPYRYLGIDIPKYQQIKVKVIKASDPRPESYKIDLDSLKIMGNPIPTTNNWNLRKKLVSPLESISLCYLQNTRKQNNFSLGFFKPRIINELIIEPEDKPNWTQDELTALNRPSMFEKQPIKTLEKIPLKFKYRFYCNENTCNGHTLSITDWEIGQSYRKWSRLYGKDWEKYFRQQYEYNAIFIWDTYFYVGTIRSHPDTWIIIGLFYPKRETPHIPATQ
jgi:hypothetical protein